MMKEFSFFLGQWDLDYKIPKSSFSEAGTDKGTGTFSSMLNNNFILFEYSTASGSEAKGIFARDSKAGIYRYWWFENSGNYLSASCNFINNDTLMMHWQDSLLVQTFKKCGDEKIILTMQQPSSQGNYETIMEVVMTKKH